jgi:chorismate synthase
MIFLTAGESHGEALTGIINEYPSGIEIDTDFINSELARRQMGFGRGQRMSIEKDEIKILSGIRKGVSTGSPISFIINNLDWKNQKDKLDSEEDVLNPRPGHADLPGILKYRLNSIREVLERSSARETAVRVAVGAFAKLFLAKFDVFILSYIEQIGKIKIDEDKFKNTVKKSFNPLKNKPDLEFLLRIENSLMRCPDEEAADKMIKLIKKTSEEGDSLGGAFRVIASGVVAGLGSFTQWDRRIDAKIAASVMSVPSVKSVSFGNTLSAAFDTGTRFHDEIFYNKKEGFYRNTNNAGGVEGGMTNGEPVDIKAIAKPIPTTRKGLKTVNIKTKESAISFKERADYCAVPSAAIVAESMLAIELVNAMQDKFGMDNIREIAQNYGNYLNYLKNI